MGAKITDDKILAEEPYRSIVNLLAEYPEGLKLREIQFCIMKNHNVCNNLSEIEKRLGEKCKQLIRIGNIKPYQSKNINRTKKRNIQQNQLVPIERRCIRSNLENFLKKMIDPSNEVIKFNSKNRKYILSDRIKNLLLVKKDIKYLEKLKDNIISSSDGRVNLYSNIPNEFKYLKHDQKKSSSTSNTKSNTSKLIDEKLLKAFEKYDKKIEIEQKKFEKAINKIRDGIDELQKLIDPPLGWSISEDKSLKCITDEKYPLIDRQLLIIFRAYTFTFSNEMYDKLYDWFYCNSDGDYEVHPDDELVNIFRKYFYPSRNVKKIREMLENHVIDDDISWDGFDHVWDLYFDIEAYSHMVAVVHSRSGITLDEDIKKKLNENLPLTSDEIHKLIFELSKSSDEFLYNYFKSIDQNLMSRIMRSKIAEKIKNNVVKVDDFINFDKSLLN